MKLKSIFEEENIGNDRIMVSLDNGILNGIIRTNSTAAFIIDCLKEEISIDSLIKKVAGAYQISIAHSEQSVKNLISQLDALNVIQY